MLDHPEGMFSPGPCSALLVVTGLIFRGKPLSPVGFPVYPPPDTGLLVIRLPVLTALSFVPVDRLFFTAQQCIPELAVVYRGVGYYNAMGRPFTRIGPDMRFHPELPLVPQLMRLFSIIQIDPDGLIAKGRWYGLGAQTIPVERRICG
jgi:hypothetical protein